MKYTVVWVRTAERRLTDIWLSAADRGAVTQTARAIDRELEICPLDVGESRDFDQRVFLSPPLGVLYEMHTERNLVRVLRVWEIKPRVR